MTWKRTCKTLPLLFSIAALGAALGAASPGCDPGGPTNLKEAANTDVTILYPLPSADLAGLLRGTDKGMYGDLVPAAAFAQIPGPLDPRPGRATSRAGEAGRAGLFLVGLRLDPCFAALGDVPASSCKNQARLIFQGVRAENGKALGDDGAVHVFIDLDRAELLTFLREILAAKEQAGGYAPGPLAVHPLMKQQGLGGAFAKALNQAVLRHGGESRVSRVTFFLRTEARQSQWFFGIYDRKEGAFRRQGIATTLTQDQVLNAGISQGDELQGDTSTPTSDKDNMLLLLDTGRTRAASPSARQAAYDAALRIENPLKHTPETIDCVSCHAATPARWATEKALGLSSQGNANAYTSKRDLTFVGPPRPSLENVHALSYLDEEPGINQRTANESAEVADAMNRLLQ